MCRQACLILKESYACYTVPLYPLYPALNRLPFSGFQSSPIADRRASAIWPAIETLQKANRFCGRGHGRQPFTDRGYFFSLNTSAPCFLKAFDMGESCPLPVLLRFAQEPGFPPQQKPRKLRGLPLNCSKKYPLPVNGCRPCPAAGAVCLLQGFDRGPNCTASPVRDE